MKQFRALDGVLQNSVLNHTIDDLRIVAALLNCFFVPVISDARDSLEIASEMKLKVEKTNILESFLKEKKVKNGLEKLNSIDLNDFPQFDVTEIRRKITFGWYQINQGLGYLAEHFDTNGNYEIRINKNVELDKDGTRLLLSSFQSRHCNRKHYDVYIKYKPHLNDVEAIVAWICTCLSGKRTCGCCSHVAGLIYYLSYGKHQEDPIKVPGKFLNKLLISHRLSDDELDISDSETNEETVLNIISLADENTSQNNTQKIKRELSVNESLNAIVKKKKPESTIINLSQLSKQYKTSFDNRISLREFSSRIPSNGGTTIISEIDFESFDLKDFSGFNNLKIVNTCSIDYFLFSFWCISNISKEAHIIIKTTRDNPMSYNHAANINILSKIINLINDNEWDRVRTLWILCVNSMKPNDQFSTFGSEYEHFIKRLLPFQEIVFFCDQCEINVTKPRNEFTLKKNDHGLWTLSLSASEICSKCKNVVVCKFIYKPFCLFVSPHENQKTAKDDDKLSLLEIPPSLKINDSIFNFLCCTIGDICNGVEHFKCVYFLNKQFYSIDNLGNKYVERKIKATLNISNCLYYFNND